MRLEEPGKPARMEARQNESKGQMDASTNWRDGKQGEKTQNTTLYQAWQEKK
jgi:hypothetical protein